MQLEVNSTDALPSSLLGARCQWSSWCAPLWSRSPSVDLVRPGSFACSPSPWPGCLALVSLACIQFPNGYAQRLHSCLFLHAGTPERPTHGRWHTCASALPAGLPPCNGVTSVPAFSGVLFILCSLSPGSFCAKRQAPNQTARSSRRALVAFVSLCPPALSGYVHPPLLLTLDIQSRGTYPNLAFLRRSLCGGAKQAYYPEACVTLGRPRRKGLKHCLLRPPFRLGMECLTHSGVGGDASRTTRPFTLCLGLLSARSHRQHTTKPVTRGVQNTLLSFPVIFSFSLKGWFLWQ
jgi:hypothetical protein